MTAHAESEIARRKIPRHLLDQLMEEPQQNKQDPKILEHDMKVTYDQEVDVLRIILNDEDIEESDEDKPGVIIDYDGQGNVVGLEVLDASTRIADPRTLEYAVTG